MRRLELLIEEARVLSSNTIYDSDSGVLQNTFVRYFKNAQDAIVKEAVNLKSKQFLKEKLISSVNAQEQYSYPTDIYLQNIDTLEYAPNGTDFIPLEKCYTKDRMSNITGFAFGYMTRENGFLLVPPISGGGTLRCNYIRNPNAPQKRCGKISAVTTSSGQITAITLDTSESSFDATLINKEYYLCIVDRDGNQVVKNVEYDSVNSGTGVITLSANHTLETGEAAAIGDYVCVGKNTTNLIELPDICESFLIDHVVYQSKNSDSSNWTKAQQDLMAQNITSLVASFGKNSDDISGIQISNFDYLSI